VPIRTTEAKVREVTVMAEGLDLTPFISDASLMVDAFCLDSGYTDAHLTRIETWLAAHLARCGKKLSRFRIDLGMGLGEQYNAKVDLGLKLTPEGQTALRLDWDGNLAAMDNAINDVTATLPSSPAAGTRRSITWLGTDPDA
jgi:hypothetical protein